MRKLDITVGEKADELLKKFKSDSGLDSDSRVLEEALFTIHEMIELAKGRSKTDTDISADRFLGILSTFTRFSKEFNY